MRSELREMPGRPGISLNRVASHNRLATWRRHVVRGGRRSAPVPEVLSRAGGVLL
jgi:hypothetical protein